MDCVGSRILPVNDLETPWVSANVGSIMVFEHRVRPEVNSKHSLWGNKNKVYKWNDLSHKHLKLKLLVWEFSGGKGVKKKKKDFESARPLSPDKHRFQSYPWGHKQVPIHPEPLPEADALSVLQLLGSYHRLLGKRLTFTNKGILWKVQEPKKQSTGWTLALPVWLCGVKAAEEEEWPGRVADRGHSQSLAAQQPTPLTGWTSPTGFRWDQTKEE